MKEIMGYVVITGRSLFWFLLTLLAAMLIISSIVHPKWLIGPDVIPISKSNFTIKRYPSEGIYTRCKLMAKSGYHCGPFDIDGFATDSTIYPPEWKAAMFFISLGFFIIASTVMLTLLTCCKQSLLGKSIHTITGSAQVIAGICVMFALFLHPLGWGTKRVKTLCSHEAEAFYPAECQIGWALYCAIAGVLLCFLCGSISLKAESANMRSKVRRRVEEGDLLVCVP